MEKKDSLFIRFLKSVGLKAHVHNNEDAGLPESPVEKIEKDVFEKAVESDNYVLYGEKKMYITKVIQGFYGNKEQKEFNTIQFDFSLEGEDLPSLSIDITVPILQREIKEGNFRYSDIPKEMFMTGELSFLQDQGDDYEEEDKPFITGDVQINCNDGTYCITGDCLLEDRTRITIQYKGKVVYNNYAPGVNGEGKLLLEDQEYLLNTAFENYNGIAKQYDFRKNMFDENVNIDLQFADTDNNYEFTIELGQVEGKKIIPGEYKITDLDPLPGTFSACFIIFSKDEDVDNTVYDLEKGTLVVTRDDMVTIRLEGEFEGGKPVTFQFTGSPEWCDEA